MLWRITPWPRRCTGNDQEREAVEEYRKACALDNSGGSWQRRDEWTRQSTNCKRQLHSAPLQWSFASILVMSWEYAGTPLGPWPLFRRPWSLAQAKIGSASPRWLTHITSLAVPKNSPVFLSFHKDRQGTPAPVLDSETMSQECSLRYSPSTRGRVEEDAKLPRPSHEGFSKYYNHAGVRSSCGAGLLRSRRSC